MENVISMSLLNIKEHRVHVSDNAISHMVISGSCKLVGTCNGLLCFTSSDQGESIFVCNPITRELVTLPKPTRTAPPESSMLIYGFGFDYLTKKYKVVRAFYPTNSRFRNPRFCVTAEVYTLGATWKAVQGFNHPPYGHPVFANGAVHWLVHPLLSQKYERIISFDISKDEFNVTPHPKFSSNISISELGGCLCVVPDIEYNLVKVWVLKDHTENRWGKEYIFHIYRPCNNPGPHPKGLARSYYLGSLILYKYPRSFPSLSDVGLNTRPHGSSHTPPVQALASSPG